MGYTKISSMTWTISLYSLSHFCCFYILWQRQFCHASKKWIKHHTVNQSTPTGSHILILKSCSSKTMWSSIYIFSIHFFKNHGWVTILEKKFILHLFISKLYPINNFIKYLLCIWGNKNIILASAEPPILHQVSWANGKGTGLPHPF